MPRRYVVIGPQAVLGKRRGEVVELEAAHARRLVAAGHVRPEDGPPDEPPGDPAPDPGSGTEPRSEAGLSHDSSTAEGPEDDKE
ncbi:hypothetical protein [Thermomonospora amylolytica]|uniref:hypothetical protein n=1 Tax=Thermomonospora amylolytica TaxID=1411117 RepID=UPI0013006086|nr:hypothetical protein [Thermomonospora amylolytica]